MQTFLPYPDFIRSALALDSSRLGNQCWRECLTLYRNGWGRHPAYRMWVGYRPALANYAMACVVAMETRGWYRAEVRLRWARFWYERYDRDAPMPPWLGDEELHASHRAALLFKDPDWYGQFGWSEEPAEKVVWPS